MKQKASEKIDLPHEPQVSPDYPGRKEDSVVESKPIDWSEVFSVIWQSKRSIGYVVGGVTLLALVISLILPGSYKSTTILLPDTERGKMAAFGGLSDLASLAGVNTGEVSLAKLYPTIINSEAVLKNVIYAEYQTKAFVEQVDLIKCWGIEGKTPEGKYEAALGALRGQIGVTIDVKTNVVTISIETGEPQLSADVVNNVTAALDNFIRTKKNTSAGEQRRFIEGRLVEVKSDLEKAENALKDFREKNRQISGSPQLLLEQERLIRDVQINTTIYTELKKQYEIVKIEEIKNIPIINVMDPARAAANREKPQRRKIVLVSFFLSVVLATGYVVAVDRYKKPIRNFFRFLQLDKNQRSAARNSAGSR